jgi:gluconolactonase
MNVEIRDDRFRSVVGDAAPLETLGSDFGFTEGPVWHPTAHHLTFSDMAQDHMRRWSAEGGVTTFRKPSNKTNGNTYDRKGRMLSCEHATSRVTRTGLDGRIEVLATHYRDKELNSPNDIVVKSNGRIYFTDPIYGRWSAYGIARDPHLDFQGVYSMNEDGSDLTLLVDDFEQPNGLCFSRDESVMFISDTPRGHIRRFTVDGRGMLSGGEIWAPVSGAGGGAPDGLKVDRDGNVYSCGPGGLHVFSPEAHSLGVIRTPEPVANFTWGGEDMRDIFLTASTNLFRARTKTPGVPLF